LLAANVKVLIVIVVAISAISLSAYSLLLNHAESSIRASMFEREKELQANRAEQLSDQIGSDLDLLMTKLQVLAESPPAQAGDLGGEEMDLLMERIYEESNAISRIEGIGISDAANIVMNVYQPEVDESQLLGQDMSLRPFAVEARENLPLPTFSSGYETVINDQGQRMALLHPIYSQGEHIGWTRSAVDASLFFERYGNIRDTGSEFFFVIDRSGNVLVSPRTWLEGENIDGAQVQEVTGQNEAISDHVRQVLGGEAHTAVFEDPLGERINTGYPIIAGGEAVYFVFLVTPTSSIYAEINDVLFTNRLQTSLLVAGIIGAVLAIVFLTTRWNAFLDREVKRKTAELAGAVEELEAKEQMQQQFINIAAHELRTPIQPLLLVADDLKSQFQDGKDTIEVEKPKIDMILRNAKRLNRLSSDILDVAKIESQSLKLNREPFSLAEMIREVTKNAQHYVRGETAPSILFESSLKDGLMVSGDRGRITEVMDNLLNNAIKFTNGGSITVALGIERDSHGKESALVSVRDSGIGIDGEVLPKLFTKFTTKSDHGTGLGLFISKSIVEAHGGRIWAENNADGKGATVAFSLPL
jgi:signal transduction histidine kinase